MDNISFDSFFTPNLIDMDNLNIYSYELPILSSLLLYLVKTGHFKTETESTESCRFVPLPSSHWGRMWKELKNWPIQEQHAQISNQYYQYIVWQLV